MSHSPDSPILHYQSATADPSYYNRTLHYLAILTTLATFPLIFMGGLVTTKGAGLAVPDWPNSYGYNMFLFPPNQWVAGIFYEHTHRLLGTAVGFLSLLLVLWAWGPGASPRWRSGLLLTTKILVLASLGLGLWLVFHPADIEKKLLSRSSQLCTAMVCAALVTLAAWAFRRPEPRRWVRWLAVAVLVMVSIQGALGGLRVVLLNLDLAIVHACVAQAFLCVAGCMIVVTSKPWHLALVQQRPLNPTAGRSLVRLAIVAWIVIFIQLGLGATMRHYRAGLAIPDLPLAYGRWIPPTSPGGLHEAVNHFTDEQIWEWKLDDVTLTQVWLAFSHRLGAIAVTIVLVSLCVVALRKNRGRGLPIMAVALLLLVLAQLTLGVIVILLRKPADITSYHVAVGALILLTTSMMIVWAMRLYSPAARAHGIASARPTPSTAPTYNQPHGLDQAISQG